MKKIFKLVSLTILSIIIFTSTAFSSNVLIVAQQTDAKSLDPSFSNDVYSHNLNHNIYDRLVEWSPDSKIVNCLAESYKQLDPLTLQVKITKGVKFHNGDDMTAEDVKFSIERSTTAPAAITYFADVERVDIIDPYTVNIITKVPYGPILNALAHSSGSILNKKYVEAAGADAFQKPIGTGPFKFESWKAGDRIVLSTNKDSFRGAPEVDGLIYRIIPESTTRTIALETKEIDISLVVDPVDIPIVKSKSYLKLYQTPSLSLTYLGFNIGRAPGSDLRVRQAIASAINLPDIVDAAFWKAAVPAYSVLPEATVGYNKNLPRNVRDIEKAKKLLAEAGYKDGLKLKLWLNENQSRKDSAVIIQAQLKEIGIDIEIEILEWGSYLDKLFKQEHDLYILGWSGSLDPDGGLYALFHSKNIGPSGNNSVYINPKVDELLDKGRQTTDVSVRIPIYEEAQEIIVRELAVFPLVNPISVVGAQDYIEGFNITPNSVYLLRTVKKNK
jgi:peptide/nickel transport system substrate-binding protein